MTYREFIRTAAETLKKAGIEEYENDALELLLNAENWNKTQFLLQRDEEMNDEAAALLEKQLKKRASRIPLQHITGNAWFYGRRFAVSEDVLIPRFDTEILVSEVLERVRPRECHVLDLCTGSGCIAVTLKAEGGYDRVTASDISAPALRIAEKNAAAHHTDINFVQSDLFDAVPDRFDVIVSNPPYISEKELETLSPEVREHDPYSALYGGRDGLDFYRRIAAESPAHLKQGGRIFLEIGDTQAEDAAGLLAGAGFSEIRIIRDLSGRDRVAEGILTTVRE